MGRNLRGRFFRWGRESPWNQSHHRHRRPRQGRDLGLARVMDRDQARNRRHRRRHHHHHTLLGPAWSQDLERARAWATELERAWAQV